MRARFAEVFGYSDSTAIEPASLWQLVEPLPVEEQRHA